MNTENIESDGCLQNDSTESAKTGATEKSGIPSLGTHAKDIGFPPR